MMTYNELKSRTPEVFIRITGVNKVAFSIILQKLKLQIEQEKEEHPISKRGRKTSLIIENQLLLCLIYLRSYPTFLVLGGYFKISEGYANKIYHKISKHLVNILKLPSNKELKTEGLKAVVVDASEQPIERPMKKQKDYYSGKKSDIQ